MAIVQRVNATRNLGLNHMLWIRVGDGGMKERLPVSSVYAFPKGQHGKEFIWQIKKTEDHRIKPPHDAQVKGGQHSHRQ
jgi:hypothetical protein